MVHVIECWITLLTWPGCYRIFATSLAMSYSLNSQHDYEKPTAIVSKSHMLGYESVLNSIYLQRITTDSWTNAKEID